MISEDRIEQLAIKFARSIEPTEQGDDVYMISEAIRLAVNETEALTRKDENGIARNQVWHWLRDMAKEYEKKGCMPYSDCCLLLMGKLEGVKPMKVES